MLRFEAASVSYGPQAPPAMSGLDVEVTAGEIVGLVGPSGAGKSTALALAAGRVRPSEGRVESLGVDTRVLTARSRRSVRSRIGPGPQDLGLVGPLPVVHNVAAGRLGRWGTARSLRSLIRPVDLGGITAVLDRLGIADKIWHRADELSGGERQRAAVARTLYQQPSLLLIDEPVSALDQTWSRVVMGELVSAVGPDRAMVVSLHDAALAIETCQRIFGLRSGRLEFDLPASSVDDELLDDLYRLDGGEP